MLLPNQRKAIQDAVDHGADLPAALASALLAALHEAETSWQRISVHLQVERAAVAKLECERDEILRVKADVFRMKEQLEKEIDQRVDLRTRDLNNLLQLEKIGKEIAQNNYEVIDQTLDRVQKSFSVEREKYQGIILQMRVLLEQKLKPTLISRLYWNRSAKRVLKDARLEP